MKYLKPSHPSLSEVISRSKQLRGGFFSRWAAVLAAGIMLLPCHVHADAVPEISRLQGRILHFHNSDPVVIWGAGMESEDLEVLGGSVEFDEEKAFEILKSRKSLEESLPAEPTENAAALRILNRDPRGFAVAVDMPTPRTERRGLVWLRTSEGTSAPFPVYYPQVLWTFPAKVHPGGEFRIFGKNLRAMYRDTFAVLRPLEGDDVVRLEIIPRTARGEAYEIPVRIPEGTPPGDYELLVHNTTASNGAWSRPVPLKVSPAPEPAGPRFVKAAQHGAKGDGVTDDTEAILAALEAAKPEGATVLLGVGKFLVSGTIEIPEGVSLQGTGQTLTVIQVSPEGWKTPFPVDAEFQGYSRDWLPLLEQRPSAPILWMRDRSSLSDLEIIHGKGTGIGILVARAPGVGHDLTIERIKVTELPELSENLVFQGIKVMGETENFTVRNCEFHCVAITVLANRHPYFYFGYNQVRATRHGFPLQAANLVFLRGTINSIVEENTIENGDRNIVLQGGMLYGKDEVPEGIRNISRSSFHTAFIANTYINNIPRRHNAGEIMFEGGAVTWTGSMTKISPTEFRLSSPLESDYSENWVMVVDGRGIGQYRQIASNTGDTIVLEEPFGVLPDEDSTLAIGSFVVEHLWIDNTEENTANWTGFWGAHLGHVISGQINRGGEGIYLWANSDRSLIAFIEIEGNWLTDRSRIVLRGRGPIFGTSITHNEIANFGWRSDLHGTKTWAHPHDNRVIPARKEFAGRQGIWLETASREQFYPETTPFRDWNILSRNLIVDGPVGIELQEGANYNIVDRNVLSVTRDEIIDHGEHNIIGQQFGAESENRE